MRPLPAAQAAEPAPAPAPIMAAQVAVRVARPKEMDAITELASRARVHEAAADVSDLTSAIGRELRVADAPARRVSLR